MHTHAHTCQHICSLSLHGSMDVWSISIHFDSMLSHGPRSILYFDRPENTAHIYMCVIKESVRACNTNYKRKYTHFIALTDLCVALRMCVCACVRMCSNYILCVSEEECYFWLNSQYCRNFFLSSRSYAYNVCELKCLCCGQFLCTIIMKEAGERIVH